MFRKSTILALAAVASLGSVALSSTSASAFGHGGMHFGGGSHGGSTMHAGGNFNRSVNRGNFGFRRVVNVRPHWHPHWRFGWRHPYWIAPVVATGLVGGYSVAPTWNRCTCLTKEYTQEGAVVFKDLCTQESAMNPPGNQASEDTSAPQQPQMQGYVQPQQNTAQPQYR